MLQVKDGKVSIDGDSVEGIEAEFAVMVDTMLDFYEDVMEEYEAKERLEKVFYAALNGVVRSWKVKQGGQK